MAIPDPLTNRPLTLSLSPVPGARGLPPPEPTPSLPRRGREDSMLPLPFGERVGVRGAPLGVGEAAVEKGPDAGVGQIRAFPGDEMPGARGLFQLDVREHVGERFLPLGPQDRVGRAP